MQATGGHCHSMPGENGPSKSSIKIFTQDLGKCTHVVASVPGLSTFT